MIALLLLITFLFSIYLKMSADLKELVYKNSKEFKNKERMAKKQAKIRERIANRQPHAIDIKVNGITIETAII